MKKLVSIFILVAVFCLSITTAFAATPRSISTADKSLDVSISGNTAYCQVNISAFSSSTSISGTMTLTGNGVSKSWPISGTGSVNVTKAAGVTSGTYQLTFSGRCGSDSIYMTDRATK